MDNFFPAYMDIEIPIGKNANLRYNEKFQIGMMYIKGYKHNPVHYEKCNKEEITEQAKSDYEVIETLIQNAKDIITTKKHDNGRFRKSTKIHRR